MANILTLIITSLISIHAESHGGAGLNTPYIPYPLTCANSIHSTYPINGYYGDVLTLVIKPWDTSLYPAPDPFENTLVVPPEEIFSKNDKVSNFYWYENFWLNEARNSLFRRSLENSLAESESSDAAFYDDEYINYSNSVNSNIEVYNFSDRVDSEQNLPFYSSATSENKKLIFVTFDNLTSPIRGLSPYRTMMENLKNAQLNKKNTKIIYLVKDNQDSRIAFQKMKSEVFLNEDSSHIEEWFVTSNATLYPWVKDMFWQIGEKKLLRPKSEIKNIGYKDVADKVGSKLLDMGFSVFDTDLIFRQGDFQMSDKHVFVSKKSFLDNITALSFSEEKTAAEMNRIFNKNIVVVPDLASDLDYFLTVAWDFKKQKEVLLIQSPELLLKTIFEIDSLPIEKSEFMQIFANPNNPKNLKYKYLRELESIESYGHLQFVQTLAGMPAKYLFENLTIYREFIQKMENLGYEVVELPGLPRIENRRYSHAFEGAAKIFAPEPKRKTGPGCIREFSYNNIQFIEQNALVPSFGIPHIDQLAFQRLEELGYDIIPMSAAQVLSPLNGGPACATNVVILPEEF